MGKMGLLSAIGNASKGLWGIARGRMFRIGLAFGVAAVAVSWIFPFAAFDRLVVLTFVFLVLCLEGFNSTLERLLDLVKPERDDAVKVVKDMLAGTVLIGAVGALFGGVIILVRVLELAL
jgi:diacylglycerol kinase